ncbi:MAG: type VI secretion system-associated protein TagF [Nitrospirota bacterium]|nr:type VI secretion system-associated protein TagF [Nitrospirota bacterium]
MRAGWAGEIGCFGKLPVSPEFIRVNAKGTTLEAFDQWIQEGLLWCRAKIGPQWRNDFLQSEPWNFMFHIPKQREWLIGVLVPSHDKAGRVFPMMVFYRLCDNTHGDSTYTAMYPLFFQEFLENAKNLLQDEWKTLSLVEFREQVGKLLAPNPLKSDQMTFLYDEFLQSYSLKTLLKACGVSCQGLTDEAVKVMVQEMVGKNHPSLNSQMGKLMAFPLIHEPAFPFEIPFWMDYVASLTAPGKSVPLLLWNKCPRNGRAILLMQESPLAPKSFWSLLHPTTNLESLWKMCSIGDTEPGVEEEELRLGNQQRENFSDHSLHGLLERQHI